MKCNMKIKTPRFRGFLYAQEMGLELPRSHPRQIFESDASAIPPLLRI